MRVPAPSSRGSKFTQPSLRLLAEYCTVKSSTKVSSYFIYLEVQDGAALRVVESRGAVEEAEEERDGRGAGDNLEAVTPRKQPEI